MFFSSYPKHFIDIKYLMPIVITGILISLTGFLHTIADLLMDPSADSIALDGISLLPTIFDPVTSTRNVMVQHSASGKLAVRQENWKLITVPDGGSPHSSSYMKRYDPIHWISSDEMQLYDVQKDIR